MYVSKRIWSDIMSEEMRQILGQAVSIIATAITILSYQLKDKNKILFAQILSTACLAGSYFLLGASSGFYLNLVGIGRNLCYYFQPQTGRFRYFSSAFFALAMCAVGILFWQGPADLLIIIALAINAVALSLFSAQGLRYSVLFTCALMTVYAAVHFNVGAVLNESFSILSAAVGIFRYRKKNESR